jgi:glutathione reductase (NADPH)
MSEFDFDLFVIGGGSGGVRAARIAASHGARVALAEQDRFGGTCVIRGCVPKKLLVYASRVPHEIDVARGYGWDIPQGSFSWGAMTSAMHAELNRLEGLYKNNLLKAGVSLFEERAEIHGPQEVRLVNEGRVIKADKILVATGGRPNKDETLEGMEHAITSDDVFHLDTLPRSIVIAGAGYIALEFACLFNALGVDTTVIYRGDMILRGFDLELRELLQAEMEKQGVKFVFNDVFTRLEKTASGLQGHTKKGQTLSADHILFAIGRSPNTRNLGLEKAGISLCENGSIPVDAYCKTSCECIYAVGDVISRIELTPVAIREGHFFADTVFGGQDKVVNYDNVATAVFTTPELATVGCTQEEAVKKYSNIDIYRTRFRPMRTLFAGKNDIVLMKLLVNADTGQVVGAHLAGEG